MNLTVKSSACAGWFIYCGEVHNLAENKIYPNKIIHHPRIEHPTHMLSKHHPQTYTPKWYNNSIITNCWFNRLNTRIVLKVTDGKVLTVIGPAFSLHCFVLQYYNMYLHVPARECVMEIHPWIVVSQVYQLYSKSTTERGLNCSSASSAAFDTLTNIKNISMNPRCEVFALTFQLLSRSVLQLNGNDMDTALDQENPLGLLSELLKQDVVYDIPVKPGVFHGINHYMSPSDRTTYTDYINRITVKLNGSCTTATFTYAVTYRDSYLSRWPVAHYFTPSYSYEQITIISDNIYHFSRTPHFFFSFLIFEVKSDKRQQACQVIIQSRLERAPQIKYVTSIPQSTEYGKDIYYVLWAGQYMTWKEANSECQSIGSQLPSISDTKDEEILKSILLGHRFEERKEHFRTPVPKLHTASLFIGFNMSKVSLWKY